ncbi:MAG: hypothetical protein ACOX6F_06580 [Syntrophomonadaceae bacterium]|mgnify:CR=1 FL=1|jgi:hypothetical protein|nr:hypothetical protein [Bacillota bacterium]NLM88590.1 hypothetical protein [Syntrophomonadaceae bacterium]HAA08200.1 hypothetical protein [Syntrophomonas sp.]HQA49744.1 hypothetical protein [Syntrophomonadaceae bacterium]HQD91091.1 hypothetical protein [Syntrophomonadaceae bacterium]
MNRRWGKGEPVNLSDLLKITPVANEIIQLSEELDMSTTDVMWIVSQIIDNQEAHYGEDTMIDSADLAEDGIGLDEDWEDIDVERLEEEMDRAQYTVNVRINSSGRFPEIGFKAGVSEKEDINYFFDMVMEMLDKLE